MKPVVHLKGPTKPGVGDRRMLLDRAFGMFSDWGFERSDILRVDVPGRGESAGGDGSLRAEVEPVVPALQSQSLFGGDTGVLVMDAHQLSASEGSVLASLLTQIGSGQRVVLVSTGALPAVLVKVVKGLAEVVSVKKLVERDALRWVRAEARDRGLRLGSDAVSALVKRFGSDVGSLGQALDQLGSVEGRVTGDLVLERWENRPDEPLWKLTDAVGRGSVDDALGCLRNVLVRSHPLVVVATLENDLRSRALAAAAPDIETFASWIGRKPSAFPTKKMWGAASGLGSDVLSKAVDAVRRADQVLKTMPAETHLVTLERLLVALCLWYKPVR